VWEKEEGAGRAQKAVISEFLYYGALNKHYVSFELQVQLPFER